MTDVPVDPPSTGRVPRGQIKASPLSCSSKESPNSSQQKNPNCLRIRSVLFPLILDTCTGKGTCCPSPLSSWGAWDRTKVSSNITELPELPDQDLTIFLWLNVSLVATSFPLVSRVLKKLVLTVFVSVLVAFMEG